MKCDPSITLNADGTFRIEEFGSHYGHATIGEAIGWFAERLIQMQEDARHAQGNQSESGAG